MKQRKAPHPLVHDGISTQEIVEGWIGNRKWRRVGQACDQKRQGTELETAVILIYVKSH